MLIEVYSDTVCPWCYVGVERLLQALAQRPERAAEVRWLPFELNPDMPDGGMDRAEYMLQKFGDVNRFAGAHGQLRELGAEFGIEFDFAAINRVANTRRSHALLAWAEASGRQTDVNRALLRAYFSQGRDIGDPTVLTAIAAECGLDGGAAAAALEDPQLRETIEALEAQALQWGISGVPTFIFDRRFAFSGAQQLPVFLEAIDATERT